MRWQPESRLSYLPTWGFHKGKWRQDRCLKGHLGDLVSDSVPLTISCLAHNLPCVPQQALVALQLHTGIQIRILESWKELGDFASIFTKAVAEAPFK